jgi:hypothetical protein
MKAYQRKIREKEAEKDPRPVVGLENATVVEIAYEKAKEIILRFEWLKNMGTTERSFGLILDGELAGVVCFGKTAGTDTAKSVCGEDWARYVVTLCRGACVHWHTRRRTSSAQRAGRWRTVPERRRAEECFCPRMYLSLIRTRTPGKLELSLKPATGCTAEKLPARRCTVMSQVNCVIQN